MTNRVVTTCVLSIAALLAVACSTPAKVRVDSDRSTNFANYKTFAWFAVPEQAPADAPAAAGQEAPKPIKPRPVDSMAHNRMRDAIQADLQEKGYTLDENAPNFKVSYALSVFDRPKQSNVSIGLGAGRSTGNASGGVGVSMPLGSRTETVAMLTVDVIDVGRNAQVWTGSYEKRVRDTVTDEDAKELVTKILEKFPPDPNAKK